MAQVDERIGCARGCALQILFTALIVTATALDNHMYHKKQQPHPMVKKKPSLNIKVKFREMPIEIAESDITKSNGFKPQTTETSSCTNCNIISLENAL